MGGSSRSSSSSIGKGSGGLGREVGPYGGWWGKDGSSEEESEVGGTG